MTNRLFGGGATAVAAAAVALAASGATPALLRVVQPREVRFLVRRPQGLDRG